MQLLAVEFTKNDIAKYPFLQEAAKYMKIPDLDIDDLTDPELQPILERGEERVEEAILYARVTRKLGREDIEIASYPAAMVLAAATKSSFIQKRYALSEAKQAYDDLRKEPKTRLLKFAENFNIKLMTNENPEIPFGFMLHFPNYLENTTHLRGKKWKLVNRLLKDGNVFLTKNETARLLSEEVRRHIEERLKGKDNPKFPPKIVRIAEKMKKLTVEKIGKAQIEGFPKKTSKKAFPPCIHKLYEAVSAGRHLSHIGRFTLTSFLSNIGMPTETIIDLFKEFSDYSERMTRYQVEHIAGEKGSRTRYIPPKCDTLKTHGVCANPDELCQSISHPLAYYRRKLRRKIKQSNK